MCKRSGYEKPCPEAGCEGVITCRYEVACQDCMAAWLSTEDVDA